VGARPVTSRGPGSLTLAFLALILPPTALHLQRGGARLLRALGDGLAGLVTRARTGVRIAPELMDATQEAMGGAYFLINQLVAARVDEPVLATALATVVRPKSIRIPLVRPRSAEVARRRLSLGPSHQSRWLSVRISYG